MENQTPGSPFYKRWWFWLIVVFILLFGSLSQNSNPISPSVPITSGQTTMSQTIQQTTAAPVQTGSQQQATPTKTSNQAVVATASIAAPVNWNNYQEVSDNFFKDPPAYIGTEVKIGGSAIDFLAAGDRGGSTNYIEIVAASNDANINGQKFMLEIDNSGDYLAATDVLNAAFSNSNLNATNMGTSGIIAYGTIEASQEFTTSSGGSIYVPVIDVERLDTCNELACSVGSGSTQGTQTIFPAGIQASMPAPEPTPSPEPPPACTLTFNESSIDSGSPVVLSWETANATSLYIDNDTGFMTPVSGGSITLTPGYSTIYTGQAVGPGGSTECTAIISVNS